MAQPASPRTPRFRPARSLGCAPDMVAGHSYGGIRGALRRGVFDFETLCRLSVRAGRASSRPRARFRRHGRRGRFSAEVGAAVESLADVWLSNFNSPRQTILSGSHEGSSGHRAPLRRRDSGAPLPVACAFILPSSPRRERSLRSSSRASNSGRRGSRSIPMSPPGPTPSGPTRSGTSSPIIWRDPFSSPTRCAPCVTPVRACSSRSVRETFSRPVGSDLEGCRT
jgi:hypothetical protein